MLMQLQSISQPILERGREPKTYPYFCGTEISMVAVWAEKNNLNTYDIRYQKFDDQGTNMEKVLVVKSDSNSVLTNLSTNEFSISGDGFEIQIDDSNNGQMIGRFNPFDQNLKGGLQSVQFDDGSYSSMGRGKIGVI